jgi:hypothetical protein
MEKEPFMTIKLNYKKILSIVLALFFGILVHQINPTYVYADDSSGKIQLETEEVPVDEITGSTGASNELEKFVLGDDDSDGFIDVVAQFGYLLIAFGIGQIVFAFKDDNADSKQRGVMVLLGGTFCAIIKPILIGLGAI